MKKFTAKNSPLFLFAAAAALFLFAFLSLELYADDLYYATFMKGGFCEFAEKAKDHFQTFNGRNFVHIIIWFALALGKEFTALLMTTVLFAIPLTFSAANKRADLSFCAVFTALVMLLSPVMLRETLFWTSGFFNYVFPFFCLVCALALQKKAYENQKLRFVVAFCPLHFLFGATTEQIGATAVFASFLFALCAMASERKLLPRLLAAPTCGALGWASIFASPATRARMEAESAGNLFGNAAHTFTSVGIHVLREGAFLLVLVFIALTLLRPPAYKKAVRTIGVICLAAATAAHFLPGRRSVFFAFGALCLYAVFCGILCLPKSESRLCGICLLSGVFSVAVICFTSSAEPRSALAFAFGLALFSASSICKIAVKTGARALLCLFCALAFLPTLAGYAANGSLRNRNLAAIDRAKESGTLYYSIDYAHKYAHSLMFDDGYFYNTFASLHGLENAEIVLTSEILPAIYYGGEKLPCPAIEKDGKLWFPLESSVAAMGGSTAWSPEEMQIHVRGRKLSLRASTVFEGEREFDASLCVRRDFFCILVSESFMRDILGTDVVFSAQENAYYIS